MATKALTLLSFFSSAFASPHITQFAKRSQPASVCNAYPYSSATNCLKSGARATSTFIDDVCGPFPPTSTAVTTITTNPTVTSTITTFLETVFSPTATTVVTANATVLSTTCITTTLTLTNNRTSTSFIADVTDTRTVTATNYTCPATLQRIAAAATISAPPVPRQYRRATATVPLGSCLETVSAEYGAQALVTACDCVQSGRFTASATRTDIAYSGSTVTEIETSTITTRTIHGIATSSDIITVTRLITSIETSRTTVPAIVSATRTHTTTTTQTINQPEPTNFSRFRLSLSDPALNTTTSPTYASNINIGTGTELGFSGSNSTGDLFGITSANEFVDLSLSDGTAVLTNPDPHALPLLFFLDPDATGTSDVLKVDICKGKLRSVGGVFGLCKVEGKTILAWGATGNWLDDCEGTDVWVVPESKE